MKSRRVITLTTDFGQVSPYVAEMKGAILSVNADVQIVDVTHCVEPQNVLQGALHLRQISDAFPQGTVHVAVVDPGVGTNRRILLVESNGQYFIAPDNGLLTFAMATASSVRVIDNDAFWNKKVTATFHGRDIMGPVAAHLCNGTVASQLSSESKLAPIRLNLPEPVFSSSENGKPTIEGQVLMIDSFGNLITNIHEQQLPTEKLRVEYQSKFVPFVKTYGEAETGTVVSLIGSSGWLELAVNAGNAATELQGSVGDSVFIFSK